MERHPAVGGDDGAWCFPQLFCSTFGPHVVCLSQPKVLVASEGMLEGEA
jgi:hypothetical protein